MSIYLHPKASEGAAWGGLFQTEQQGAVTYGFCIYMVGGGGAGMQVWAGCETTDAQGEGREGILELDAF